MLALADLDHAAGRLAEPDETGKRFLKVPLNAFEGPSIAPEQTTSALAVHQERKTMQLRKLSDDVSVTAQIMPGNVDEIAAAGFKSVICNRPDGESPGQPPFSEIAAAATSRGLAIHHQPVVSGRLGGDNVEDFGRLVADLPKPILAYCRTGARSTQLWTLWQSE